MLKEELENLQKIYDEAIDRGTDLQYQLYVANQKKTVKTMSEMTDDDITKKIEGIVVGVIRQATGKVS